MQKCLGLMLIMLWGVLGHFVAAASPTEEAYQRGRAAYDRQDYTTALREWQPLAQQGLAAAQVSLGSMYEHGWGVPRDDAEAVRWYQKAAAQGEASGQNNLGLMYAQGRGVPHDDAEAVRWFRQAAVQGNASGQYNLGWMYAQGRGVAHDDAEAVRWFRQAAVQGRAKGQYILGVMYEQGRGVAQNLVEAQRWYQKAAETFPPGADRDNAIAAQERVARQLAAAQVSVPPSHTPTVSSSPPFPRPSPPPPSPPGSNQGGDIRDRNVAESVISGPAATSQPGVAARYFADHSYNTPKKSGMSQTLALDWSSPPVIPLDGKHFWVEWEGLLNVPAAGRHEFRLAGDGQGFLYLDGKRVIRETERSGGLALAVGAHTIRLGAIQERPSGTFALMWKREGDRDYALIDPRYLSHTQSHRQWKRTPRQAAQVGLEWLQSDSIAWQGRHQCFGCHVQGQVIMGLSVARANNYVVSEDYLKQLVEFTKQQQHPDGKYHSGHHLTATQFAAMGLAFFDKLAKAKAENDTLLRAVNWLVERQAPTGEMAIDHVEPPIDQGSIMTTANSVVAFLHAFVITGETRFRQAADRALAWISGSSIETTQDKAFKVIALARSGRPEYQQLAAQGVAQLKAEQMGDGGSRETSAMPGSNAYATGQVLCAFQEAGVSVDSMEFQRGVRFLLNRQRVTGAWPFENTQSHRHSEFALTMWPVICLAGSFVEIAPEPTGRLQVVSDIQRSKKPTKNLEVILDLSGSMNSPLGQTTRWQTALDGFSQLVARLPDDFNVGLRVYGYRYPSRSPQTCTDTELVVPITRLNRNQLISVVSRLRPRGDTPLVYSVLQAAVDLKARGGGSIILITDGEETCKGDPVKAADQLQSAGVDVTLRIVGFTIKGKRVEQQLTTFAEATGGRYYSAQSGDALVRALLIAAVEKFPYQVFDASGRLGAKGEAGSPADELPPGEYQVVVQAADQVLMERVIVSADRDTVLKVILKNDRFVVEGSSVAVPVDTENRLVPQRLHQGAITRPGLGVRIGDDRVSRRLNLPGVLIIDISKGSAAEAAGLRGTRSDARGGIAPGDIIVGIDNDRIETANDLFKALEKHAVGETVHVTVVRGEARLTVAVKLQAGR